MILAAMAGTAGCGGKATATGAGGTVAVTEGDIFLDQPEYRVTNGAVRIDVTNVGKLHHDLRVRNQQYFVETNPGGKSTGTVTLGRPSTSCQEQDRCARRPVDGAGSGRS